MIGCFIVDNEDDRNPLDIVFRPNDKFIDTEIPSEQLKLYNSIAYANSIIKSLKYTDNDRKRYYIQELRSLAQTGLVGDKALPNLAADSLTILKNEIVKKEGPRIKNEYMLELGKMAGIFSVIAILGLAFVNYVHSYEWGIFLYVWIGAMLGAWISFGARKMSIEFDKLDNIEDDMMYPYIRLMFVGIVSIILLLFIKTSIITIDIGSFSTTQIQNNLESQLLLGLICGLAESKLAVNIYKKAGSITDSINKNKD
ncbi:MAG: hypothetical protein ABRQ25_14805 [Clostridiaceae bacterium]